MKRRRRKEPYIPPTLDSRAEDMLLKLLRRPNPKTRGHWTKSTVVSYAAVCLFGTTYGVGMDPAFLRIREVVARSLGRLMAAGIVWRDPKFPHPLALRLGSCFARHA